MAQQRPSVHARRHRQSRGRPRLLVMTLCAAVSVAALPAIEYWFVEKRARRVHKRVEYFLLAYVSGDAADFDAHEVSGAEWFSWDAGIARLSFDNERCVARTAREIAEQLGWRLPDAVIAPMAGGALVTRLRKGFREFVSIVKSGRKVEGRAQFMPAWGSVLKDEDIYKVGAYLETLAIEGANWKEAKKQ